MRVKRNGLYLVIAIGIVLFGSHSVSASGEGISGGSGTYSGPVYQTMSIPDIQIFGSSTSNPTIRVSLAARQGVLSLPVRTGLIFANSYSPGTNQVFTGNETDVNAALASLTYMPFLEGPASLEVSYGPADGTVYNPANGHVYKYTTVDDYWGNSKFAAQLTTYSGVNGHLATITSLSENDFLANRMASTSWVGASDWNNEGDWQWVTGPENGQAFWLGDADGVTVNNGFAAWRTGMPDNYQLNENCLELEPSSSWNDQDCGASRVSIIEYETTGITPFGPSKTISINATGADNDSDGSSDTTEDAGPNSGDANNDGTPDSQQANVVTHLNPYTNQYQAIETDCSSIKLLSVINPNAITDTSYSYPMGLTSFNVTCASPGDTATVSLYNYGVAGNSSYVVRKSSGGAYTTIPGAQLAGVPIGGDIVFKVSYTLVDGGEFDEDGLANGTILDPSGIAVPVPTTSGDTLAPTGGSQSAILLLGSTLIGLGVLLLAYRRLRIL